MSKNEAYLQQVLDDHLGGNRADAREFLRTLREECWALSPASTTKEEEKDPKAREVLCLFWIGWQCFRNDHEVASVLRHLFCEFRACINRCAPEARDVAYHERGDDSPPLQGEEKATIEKLVASTLKKLPADTADLVLSSEHHPLAAYFGKLDLESLQREFPERLSFL